MGEGIGKIDLDNCELSIVHKGRYYKLRAFSETQCQLVVIARDAPDYVGIHSIESLRNSDQVPDVINWLARGFAGIPVRFKEAAFARVVKR